MNLPNGLTCLRILLSFVLLFLLFLDGFISKAAALVVFGVACFTDYWDGRLARRYGQVTSFGRLMDPIADKLLALAAFIAFTQKGIVPAWMVMLVVARDFLITGIRLMVSPRNDLQAARPSGKNKTAIQFTFILGVLLYLAGSETNAWSATWNDTAVSMIRAAMLGVVVITLWSGALYLLKNRALFDG